MASPQQRKSYKASRQGQHARSRRTKRTDKETAIAILKTDFRQNNSTAPRRSLKHYDQFHDEMIERHEPYLPLHFDMVRRATQLRYGLERMHRFKDQFFASLEEVADVNTSVDPERRQWFTDLLEMILRTDGLKKLSQYEADLSEEVRKNNKELEELADWQHREGFKRGQIGYQFSQPLGSDTRICYDEPAPRAPQDAPPPQLSAREQDEASRTDLDPSNGTILTPITAYKTPE
ncbi:hypothetical protein [Hyphomicrobium sp. MC8b]|uniref:hypothetical protein n=1 Tax=Hyphomicrobium sp. MC8b TaxID=300273 RepID=UPI0039191B77